MRPIVIVACTVIVMACIIVDLAITVSLGVGLGVWVVVSQVGLFAVGLSIGLTRGPEKPH